LLSQVAVLVAVLISDQLAVAVAVEVCKHSHHNL
jgi:hypothetical protein